MQKLIRIFIFCSIIQIGAAKSQITFYNASVGKFGAIDSLGKVIIQPKYDEPIYFENGYGEAYLNNKWGIIDAKDNIIIPFEYEYICSEAEGLFSAKKNGQYGFIDKNNKVIIPFTFDWTGIFHEGIAWIKNGEVYGLINKKGEEITPIIYEDITYFDIHKLWYCTKGDKVYKLNNKGEIIGSISEEEFQKEKEEESYREQNSNNLLEYTENGLKGYKNLNGKVVIKAKFLIKRSLDFRNGYAGVSVSEVSGYGLIDTNGEYVIKPDPKFTWIETNSTYFINGVCIFQVTISEEIRKCFFFNKKGKKIFECDYFSYYMGG